MEHGCAVGGCTHMHIRTLQGRMDAKVERVLPAPSPSSAGCWAFSGPTWSSGHYEGVCGEAGWGNTLRARLLTWFLTFKLWSHLLCSLYLCPCPGPCSDRTSLSDFCKFCLIVAIFKYSMCISYLPSECLGFLCLFLSQLYLAQLLLYTWTDQHLDKQGSQTCGSPDIVAPWPDPQPISMTSGTKSSVQTQPCVCFPYMPARRERPLQQTHFLS